MGGPIARNLAKAGYPVTVFETDEKRLAGFVAAGDKAVRSVGEVGRSAEIVLLSLPTGDVVHELV